MSKLLKDFLQLSHHLFFFFRLAYQDLKLPSIVKKVGSKVLSKTNSVSRFKSVWDCGPKLHTIWACSDAGNDEHLKVINDLQLKLEVSNAELISAKEKVVLIDGLFTFYFYEGLSIHPFTNDLNCRLRSLLLKMKNFNTA